MWEKLVSEEYPGGHADFQAKWGGYNDKPPNWKVLTQKEFAQSGFFQNSILHMDYRQIILPVKSHPKGVYCGVRLFFTHHNRGFAMWEDYWGGKIYYAQFGLCDHEWQEMSSAWCAKHEPPIYHGGRCYHVNCCKKCGEVNAYDSSD